MSSVLEDRLPVWEALSDLFLDCELGEADYSRVAEVLASSPYSIEEMEDILRNEVYPVLIGNLRTVAGEWAGFDSVWLRKAIAPRLYKRPKIRFPQLQWFMIRDHWTRIVELILSIRKSKTTHTKHRSK